jgi:hypothetical protein
MISPEFTDTEAFESTRKILAGLLPAMPEPARRRAAWNVAKCRLSLAAAVEKEGHNLDGTPPPTATDAVHLEVAAKMMERAALEGRTTKAVATAFKKLADDTAAQVARRNA